MPSHENNPSGGDKDGKPRRRRRPSDHERLTKRGLTPMRFELPDNALAGYPPAPPPPAPALLPPPVLPRPPIMPPPPIMLEAPPAPDVGAAAPNERIAEENAAGEGASKEEASGGASIGLSIPSPQKLGVAGAIRLARPIIVYPRERLRGMNPRHRALLWGLLGLVVGVPTLLTLIGKVTSPPHIKGVPTGHLVYLEAEAPSEKTTTLRGLYAAGPDGATHLLTHETEPQDTDGGVREWITQPALSADGKQVAFEKQLIMLQEEKQTIQNQIWVMPLAPGSDSLPRLVVDLTQQKLKQPVGLAWDSDSSLVFLEDGTEYSVPTEMPDEPLKIPLNLHGLTLATNPDVSATRSPVLTESGRFVYGVQTPTGPQTLVQNAGAVTPGPAAAVFALSPAGDRIAFVPPDSGDSSGGAVVRTYDLATNAYGADIPVHWGWSVFGRRHVTSLRWSPDGTQLAFTVSKPPVPEDEIFIVDLASAKTVQLPYRAGRAAWDWSK